MKCQKRTVENLDQQRLVGDILSAKKCQEAP